MTTSAPPSSVTPSSQQNSNVDVMKLVPRGRKLKVKLGPSWESKAGYAALKYKLRPPAVESAQFATVLNEGDECTMETFVKGSQVRPFLQKHLYSVLTPPTTVTAPAPTQLPSPPPPAQKHLPIKSSSKRDPNDSDDSLSLSSDGSPHHNPSTTFPYPPVSTTTVAPSFSSSANPPTTATTAIEYSEASDSDSSSDASPISPPAPSLPFLAPPVRLASYHAPATLSSDDFDDDFADADDDRDGDFTIRGRGGGAGRRGGKGLRGRGAAAGRAGKKKRGAIAGGGNPGDYGAYSGVGAGKTPAGTPAGKTTTSKRGSSSSVGGSGSTRGASNSKRGGRGAARKGPKGKTPSSNALTPAVVEFSEDSEEESAVAQPVSFFGAPVRPGVARPFDYGRPPVTNPPSAPVSVGVARQAGQPQTAATLPPMVMDDDEGDGEDSYLDDLAEELEKDFAQEVGMDLDKELPVS
ncbi:hypothetical protein HDU93_003680 [Gonapodya sp. JEL0774]|nr:hypothetical protein HDU93_003680 [Gonapodya sp. JEL0774]